MEDFIVLSVLDLQLDATKHPKPIDKREVIAYIMLGETCIDNLILGSPNAHIQEQKGLERQNPGRAFNHNQSRLQDEQEEPGNNHDDIPSKISPISHLQKRTKIPLSGLSYGPNNKTAPKEFQIILRRIGSEKERFGSISFNLKRLQKNAGQEFKHWVTLYDSLDDDLFEGAYGADDMFDYPRIYLEYQIISSQFTSMTNQLDRLGADVVRARDKQENLRRDAKSNRTSRKTDRAKRLVTVSQTIEFVETRAAKVTGQRAPFEGRVMTEAQQENYLEHRSEEVKEHEQSLDQQE